MEPTPIMGSRGVAEVPRIFVWVWKYPSCLYKGYTRNEVNSKIGANLKNVVNSNNGVDVSRGGTLSIFSCEKIAVLCS